MKLVRVLDKMSSLGKNSFIKIIDTITSTKGLGTKLYDLDSNCFYIFLGELNNSNMDLSIIFF